jgi:hypothetical protein
MVHGNLCADGSWHLRLGQLVRLPSASVMLVTNSNVRLFFSSPPLRTIKSEATKAAKACQQSNGTHDGDWNIKEDASANYDEDTA